MVRKLSYSQRGRLGALRRYELYGNPGTPEGRSKGGRHACQFFRLHPEIAGQSSFNALKPIQVPHRSVALAGFIGIMLGDGGIRSRYQFTVSFNKKTDREFAGHVARLIKRLFGIACNTAKRKGAQAADLVVSSVSAVDFLLKQGLVAGNKVRQHVDMPAWIKHNAEYRKACVRGLFDTDGSLYPHRYKVNGTWYEYLKLDFTSCSKPLLNSVQDILGLLGITSSLKGVHITISAQRDVNRFLAVVGTSNSKFVDRWKRFQERSHSGLVRRFAKPLDG